MKIAQLLIFFWLYESMTSYAMDITPYPSSTPESSQEAPQRRNRKAEPPLINFLLERGDPIADEIFYNTDNGIQTKPLVLIPYKSPFNRRNFFHAVTVLTALGLSEIVFEFCIKKAFGAPDTHNYKRPLIIISRILLDLLSIIGSFYLYKKWINPINQETYGDDQNN